MVLDLARQRLAQKALLSAGGPLLSRLFAGGRSFTRTVPSAQGQDPLGQEDVELMWANVRLQDGHRINHLVIQYQTPPALREDALAAVARAGAGAGATFAGATPTRRRRWQLRGT
jgi:hypothetical protein